MGEKKKLVKTFIPKTISESIKITKENEQKLSLIETKESPPLESDLRYILDTSQITIWEKLINLIKIPFKLTKAVKTDYYLTYHQKKEEEQIVYRRTKKVQNYIGDEILQVITFSSGTIRHPLLICITDFEVGGTRYSKDFLQKEGFIPIERFIGKHNPKWIIICASSSASIQDSEAYSDNEKYLIIPGKINFRFWGRYGLFEYKYNLISTADFLKKYSKIRKMARENNVETTLLISEKILVLERTDTSWWNIWKIFFKSMKRHKDIACSILGSFIYNFGIGIQQGAIINPILNMMDKLGILVLLMWIMQYIYPNIVYTFSVLLSAERFDRLKAAEKNELVERATINIEIKKTLTKVAVLMIISNFLLLLIFPSFFVEHLIDLPFINIIVGAIYILSAFFRDWPVTFEQDALFRIFKRSLSDDDELYHSLLKINAFSYSGGIVINLLGIAVGWFATYISPSLGLSLACIAVVCSFAKSLYPYYGNDYEIVILTDVVPFYSSQNEMVIIPNKVSIRSESPINIQNYKGKKAIFDNYQFQIVVDDIRFEPNIKEKRHHILSSSFKSWYLTWQHGQKKTKLIIRIKLKDLPSTLNRNESGNRLIFELI